MHDRIDRRGVLTGAAGLGAGLALGAGPALAQGKPVNLLNVSYDPTRELYDEYNATFARDYLASDKVRVSVRQSHGGSGRQARSVIDGLQADVVTLALGYDIDEIANRGLIAKNWQSRLPNNSSPYFSTIVFLVRKGNPWKIRDWGDLLKPGIEVITPNPKTSGGARWNYLAAWAWAQRRPGGGEAAARQYISDLFKRVPVLDTGARGSLTTWGQRGVGDVLLAWENEAFLAQQTIGRDKVQIVIPSLSILAEPPVAVVDKIVDRKGSRKAAEAYLRGLYSGPGQEIIAKHHFRPRNAQVAAKYASKFPRVNMASIGDFGGWAAAQKRHFADGGEFDKLYKRG